MGLMDGKRGLVLGVVNDYSIAWGISQQLFNEGAQLRLASSIHPLGLSFLLCCLASDH